MGLARFRHVNAIESLEEERLNELGYYTGFACPHGHLIRDSNEHWCYECAKKILSNVCGFDALNTPRSGIRSMSPSRMSAGRSMDPLVLHQSVFVFLPTGRFTASRSLRTSTSTKLSTNAPGATWDPFLLPASAGTNDVATLFTWSQVLIATFLLKPSPLA